MYDSFEEFIVQLKLTGASMKKHRERMKPAIINGLCCCLDVVGRQSDRSATSEKKDAEGDTH